jgi:hypothetical protein
MTRSVYSFTLIAAVALGTLAFSASSAHAQLRRPMTVGQQSALNLYRASVNPNYYLPNGMSLNQYYYNTAVLAAAYSQFPAYYYGYNPYPQVINYGPVYPVRPYVTPVYPTGLYSGYSPTPFYYSPYLYGAALPSPY